VETLSWRCGWAQFWSGVGHIGRGRLLLGSARTAGRHRPSPCPEMHGREFVEASSRRAVGEKRRRRGLLCGGTYTPLNAAVRPRAAHRVQSVCALNFGLWARPIVRFLKQTCCASFFLFLFLFFFFSFFLFRFTLTDCEFCLVQNFDKFQICSNLNFF
jgi:hypothetical protein